VVISDGAASHPGSISYPPERLARLREHESSEAATVLGLPNDALRFLHLPDGRIPKYCGTFNSAVETIAGLAKEIGAGALFAPWWHDLHRDHEATFLMARAAAISLRLRLYSYPIGSWWNEQEEVQEMPRRSVRLEISAHLPRKCAAILAHRSQTTALITDSPNGFTLTPHMLSFFQQPFEVFLDI
jgi:LmbE family N-acetylglucosaminyl deacetylase